MARSGVESKAHAFAGVQKTSLRLNTEGWDIVESRCVENLPADFYRRQHFSGQMLTLSLKGTSNIAITAREFFIMLRKYIFVVSSACVLIDLFVLFLYYELTFPNASASQID